MEIVKKSEHYVYTDKLNNLILSGDLSKVNNTNTVTLSVSVYKDEEVDSNIVGKIYFVLNDNKNQDKNITFTVVNTYILDHLTEIGSSLYNSINSILDVLK